MEFISLHLNGVEREREAETFGRVSSYIYRMGADHLLFLSQFLSSPITLQLQSPYNYNRPTTTISVRSIKMSAGSTESRYRTFKSGPFEGQHWPPIDEDDVKAHDIWLESLPEDARSNYEAANTSWINSTHVQPREIPPSIPTDYETEWVSVNFPYPFGRAGTDKRVAAYGKLRTLGRNPDDRKRAWEDVLQSVAEWKGRRVLGPQSTGTVIASQQVDVETEEQGEGSTAQGTRQDTQEEEQGRVGSVGYQSSGPSRQDIEQDSEGWEGRLHPNPESPLEVTPHLRRYIGRFEYGF